MSSAESAEPRIRLTLAGAPQPAGILTPISPRDLAPLEPLPAASLEEVEGAVTNARRAQFAWRNEPLARRTEALRRAARLLLERRDQAIELSSAELGKVEVEGLFNEALGPLETISGWTGVVRRATSRRSVRLNPLSFPRKSAHVELLPRGVVGILAAWNYPVAGLYRSVFPALLTGNAVVVKPSEYTPRTSAWFLQTLAEELPRDIVQVVQGGPAVGEALIDAGIDACVFTGSTGTGRRVARRCAERGLPASVEMGGNDAAIVLADCDLPRTVAGLTHWKLSNAGQACGAVEVAYAEESIADALVERLVRAFGQLRLGTAELAEIGPLGNRRQLSVVEAHVADALAKGARLACGGSATGQGLWFQPTILDRCTPEMKVVQEETFGPVLAVLRVGGADDAIRRVNEGRYGLGASVWTSDLARGRRIASKLDVGVVAINNHALTGAMPQLPWSGTRDTGFSVANGPEALATFVRPRVLLEDRRRAHEVFWMPYDRALWDLGQVLADAQLGKLKGVWRLPGLFRARARTLKKFFE